MSSVESEREPARRTIIDAVDVPAMVACADRARALSDPQDEEFWWIEIITAPTPASDQEILLGVSGFYDHILLPSGRFNEAELYCRHLLTRSSTETRGRARELLDRISTDRAASNSPVLVHSLAWQQVDLSMPAVVTSDQQVHYNRMYAYLEEIAHQGRMDMLVEANQEQFLSYVAGWVNGFAGSDAVNRIGLARDTLVKVLLQWLIARGYPHLAPDAPRSSTLNDRGPTRL